MLEQQVIFSHDTEIHNEVDEFSKKRISVHKVAKHDTNGEVQSHSYYLIIIDASMTINIELSQASIINLLSSLKK